MAVAYEDRLTIPQLDSAIKVAKDKIAHLDDETDPRIAEKLQVMLERYQKAKAKINRYYEKTVKKNPGMVVRRDQLRVIDTYKASKRSNLVRADVKNPTNSYNLLDHLEDKRGFYIAGLGTAGGLSLLASIETGLSADAIQALGLSGENIISMEAATAEAAATQFNLLEIMGAFLKQNPGIAIALGSTAAIAVLANMPKIRAAWNKGKVNKAAILDAENEIYESAHNLNPDQQLLQKIIDNKNNLNGVANLKEDLADHPELVTRLVAILADTSDTTLPNSVKHHLLKYMVANGLGTGLPDKNTYSPHHAMLASKLAGMELSIAENEVYELSEAKKIRDARIADPKFSKVNALNGLPDATRLQTLYDMLHNPGSGSYCNPTDPARAQLEALETTIKTALTTQQNTALGQNMTGTSTKISDHFATNDLTTILASGSTQAQADAELLLGLKAKLELGIPINAAGKSLTTPSTDASFTTLDNYLKGLKEYEAQLSATTYFADAEKAAKDSTKDALGISKVEKAEAAALQAIEDKLGITTPAAKAAKLANLENECKAAEKGA